MAYCRTLAAGGVMRGGFRSRVTDEVRVRPAGWRWDVRAQRLRGGLHFRSPRLRPTGIPSFSQNLTTFPSFEVPSAPVLQARATVRQKENKNKYGGQLLHPLNKLSCHQCLAVPCQLVAFRSGCYLGILGRLYIPSGRRYLSPG